VMLVWAVLVWWGNLLSNSFHFNLFPLRLIGAKRKTNIHCKSI